MERFLPFSAARIDILVGLVETRPIWHYGIELNGRQRYNSPSLQEIRRRVGVKANGRSVIEIKVKYFERDIGLVYVYDPSTRDWMKVSHICPEYAEGVHLHQHRMTARFAKISHFEDPNYEKLLRAKELMKQEIARLRQSASLRDRRRYAKLTGESSRSVATDADETRANASTEQSTTSSRPAERKRRTSKKGQDPVQPIEAFDDFDPDTMVPR